MARLFYNQMEDVFDNKILCKNCNRQMKKARLNKNGFVMRAVVCERCGSRIVHPLDEQDYNKFKNLRNKEYKVKMRIVGNSYAVSIPKEIASFMKRQQKTFEELDQMVSLCFEDFGRLSLNFKKDRGDKS